MSTTATQTVTTATGLGLDELNSSGITQRTAPANNDSTGRVTDPILEASRLADNDVPDGGYGWVVVFSCAVICWWVVGTTYSWGVLQRVFVEQGLSSPGTLAFVGSLSTGIMSSCAIIYSRLFQRYGARVMAMMGITLIGVSEILSSFFVLNLAGLFVTNGVLLGLGLGLCFPVITGTSAQYFNRKRGLANGIVFAGGGFGGAVISLSLDALVAKVGAAWTYRILGLVTLSTGLSAAWLIRERSPVRSPSLVEWGLFKNPSFLLILATGAIGTFPLLVPPFFIPLYSRSIGLDTSTGAGLLAGFNFASAVGRIICGLLCDKLGAVNTLFSTLGISALSMLVLWPASTSLAPLALFVVVNGVSNGGFFAVMPTVVGNVFGSARVTTAMSLVVTSWMGGYLMGSPIAGYLLDAYGGPDSGLQAYRPAMFYAGSLAVGAAILVAMMRLRASKSWKAKV